MHSDHSQTTKQKSMTITLLWYGLLYLSVTSSLIVSGVIRHWNNVPTERLPIQHQSIQEEYIG